MKAAVYHRYGPPDVLKIEEVEKPAPKTNEALIRVHATTVCAADWRFRKASPFFIRAMNGLARPKKIKILGLEFAGVIEALGKSVKTWRVGDRVFGSTGFKFGANAEYVCVPLDKPVIAAVPHNMSFAEAAAIPFGGISALHFLRTAGVQAGQSVLIYGASGSVGTAAVQLAKHFGAHVTGVCSTANLELVQSLGADAVVDYKKEDYSMAGPVYDVVFDTVGKSGFGRALSSLKPGGTFIQGGPDLASFFGSFLLHGDKKLLGGVARSKPGDLDFFRSLVEAGEFRSVIDRTFPLEEIAAAHALAKSGHKKGNVAVLIASG